MVTLLKFLPAVLALQVATVALIYAVTGMAPDAAHGLPLAVAGGIVGLFAAFWFAAIADHVRKDAVAKLQLSFARERENLVVTAEVDKRAALEQTHQRISRETARANGRANLRLGFGLTGLLAVGGLLVAVEFMTLGLLLMTTAGGALGGYIVRARQEARWVRKDRPNVVLVTDGVPKVAATGSSVSRESVGS